MYFRGKLLPLGLRTSALGRRTVGFGPRISGYAFSFPERLFEFGSGWGRDRAASPLRFVELDVGSAVEERRFSAALLIEEVGLSAPVAPLGLKADADGLENAALKGPLFHDSTASGEQDPQPRLAESEPRGTDLTDSRG